MTKGFLTIHRKFFAHWLWTENRVYSRSEAWLDLLQKANFLDGEKVIKGKLQKIKRGELVASYRYLGNEWQWSLGKVKRFLLMLQKEEMIDLQTEHPISIITICNYDKYNFGSIPNGTLTEQQQHTNDTVTEHPRNRDDTSTEQSRNTHGTKRNKEKKEKNLNNEKKGKSIGAPKNSIKILEEENFVQDLQKQFPGIDVGGEIEKMRDWLAANGVRKKDYLAFARNWLRKTQEQKNPPTNQQNLNNQQAYSGPIIQVYGKES